MAQAEEYAQEVQDFEQTEAEEYMLEYEPDDYSYDTAVSESLACPQPCSERGTPPTCTSSISEWDRVPTSLTTPMPVGNKPLTAPSQDSESLDVEGGTIRSVGCVEFASTSQRMSHYCVAIVSVTYAHARCAWTSIIVPFAAETSLLLSKLTTDGTFVVVILVKTSTIVTENDMTHGGFFYVSQGILQSRHERLTTNQWLLFEWLGFALRIKCYRSKL